MKLMGIPGLTLYHLKSHLQKYRLSKNVHGQANSGTSKIIPLGGDKGQACAHMTNNLDIAPDHPNNEAVQMQIEVQRRLHEQLEVQRHLQFHIEAQGKYLQWVLEKALGKQNHNLCMRSYNNGGNGSLLDAKEMRGDLLMDRSEFRWGGDLRGNNIFLAPKETTTERRMPKHLSMSIEMKSGPTKGKDDDEDFFDAKLHLNSHHAANSLI